MDINTIFLLLIPSLLAMQTMKTDRPIIGILTLETNSIIEQHYPDARSYLSAAYVKCVEASGARVVPIFINQSEIYYKQIMNSINGLVLPGGATFFNNTGGYKEAAKIIYSLVKDMNDNKDHFPILAICLGLEVLLYLDNNEVEYRTDCDSHDVLLPLNFTADLNNSLLFGNASPEIIKILTTENITYNYHRYCITETQLRHYNLDKNWKVLSTNEDSNGINFVSTLEYNTMPIAGLQFHPEKIYDWSKKKNFIHSGNAIKVTRYFFDWLVKHARLNAHKFPTEDIAMDKLISNFNSTFTHDKLIYNEIYLFDN